MAISTGAAILGGTIGSALISSNAASKAAKAQGDASAYAVGEQARQFDTARADQQPWMQAGQEQVRTLGDLLRSGALTRSFTGDNLTSEPGYAFRLGEGNKAIENAARARGMYMSPSTVKELLRYGQDYASGEFQNAYNRDLTNRTTEFNMRSGVAGTGQTAANTLANVGSATAGNIGNLVTGAANARGAAGIAGANALTGGISTLGNWYQQNLNRQQQQSWMDRMFPSSTSSTPYAGGFGWGNT